MSATAQRPDRRTRLLDEIHARRAVDYRECSRDPVAFMGRHCTIEEPNGKVIKLRMWPFQRHVVREGKEARLLIVLKARRLGLSWIALAYALWLAIFKQGIRILILCKNEDDGKELLDRIRRMKERMEKDPRHNHLFAGLMEREGKPGKDSVTRLDVGVSVIRCLVGTPRAARSETAGFVLLDEFAFQPNAEGIWRALLPTIEGNTSGDLGADELAEIEAELWTTEWKHKDLYEALLPEADTGGQIWIVSTGDGDDNEFARQWDRAVSKASEFVSIFIPWMARPGRDAAWKQRQIDNLGDEDRFKVEYPEVPEDAFVSPDTTFAYKRSHVMAAEALGRLYDELPAERRWSMCQGGKIRGGLDWGDFSSHGLVVMPLTGGGAYVMAEHEASQQEPGEFAQEYILAVERLGCPWSLDEIGYDAAGQQPMRTFRKTMRSIPRYRRVKTEEVAFGAYKSETYGYVIKMLRRTFEGKESGVLAISPRAAKLLDQMKKLEIDPETEKISKINDHGPDALLAERKNAAMRNRDAIDRGNRTRRAG